MQQLSHKIINIYKQLNYKTFLVLDINKHLERPYKTLKFEALLLLSFVIDTLYAKLCSFINVLCIKIRSKSLYIVEVHRSGRKEISKRNSIKIIWWIDYQKKEFIVLNEKLKPIINTTRTTTNDSNWLTANNI